MKQPRDRRDDQPAFVLHAYAYRETSLIVEALTAEHGRVAMVARGAKRPRSELRGLLQAFQPLTLVVGRAAASSRRCCSAEWRGGLPLVAGSALLCGFYLNELLLKLLPREDPHPQLFRDYEAALARAGCRRRAGAGVAPSSSCGCWPSWATRCRLTHEADTGAADRSSRHATITPSIAGRACTGGGTGAPLSAGARRDAAGARAAGLPRRRDAAAEAKRLMREVLDHYLEQRGDLQPPRRAGPAGARRRQRRRGEERTDHDRARRQHRPRRDAAPGAPHLRARSGLGRGRGAPGRRRRHHRAPARGPAPHPGRGRAPAARARAHQAQSRDGGDRRDGRHRLRAQARDGDAGARGPAGGHDRGRARRRWPGGAAQGASSRSSPTRAS